MKQATYMIVRAAKWVAGKTIRIIPEPILGRLLPGKFAFSGAEMPAPPDVPDASIRLFIAPVNYAGQGWQWARAVTAHIPDAGAVNMVCRTSTDFRHPADNVVPLGFYAASRRWQRMQRDTVTEGFTHVMIEAEKQPFGALLDETTKAQISRLQRHGVKVLMVCHGSDIRLPSRHIANNSDSPFIDALIHVAPTLERIAKGNRRMLDDLGLPVFVTTPDLILDVPYASWLPSIVDIDRWRTETPALERARPVVAHAPSKGATKGSEFVDPILSRLDDEGLVTYNRIKGVPFDQMPGIYRDADIVIDQIRLGDYDVVACEAMAAGRVVVGHVSEHTRAHVLKKTGRDVPVVEATAQDLDLVIRKILADRGTYREIALEGIDYATDVHDGRMSAGILRSRLV